MQGLYNPLMGWPCKSREFNAWSRDAHESSARVPTNVVNVYECLSMYWLSLVPNFDANKLLTLTCVLPGLCFQFGLTAL
jgi:hypothetical protein